MGDVCWETHEFQAVSAWSSGLWWGAPFVLLLLLQVLFGVWAKFCCNASLIDRFSV